MNEQHIGGSFDDFLREEGIYEEVEAMATELLRRYRLRREKIRQRHQLKRAQPRSYRINIASPKL